jgi:LEA14-like dessication related protein
MRIRSLLRAGVCVATAALCLGACAPDVIEPEIDIVGVRGGTIGLEGGEVLLLVRVDNPNDFAITASRVDYDLDLRRGEDWFDLAEGTLEEGLDVPGYGQVTVEIPVAFRLSDAIRVGADLLGGGSPTFRVSGRVDLQRPIRRRVPYREEITADLGARDDRDRQPR